MYNSLLYLPFGSTVNDYFPFFCPPFQTSFYQELRWCLSKDLFPEIPLLIHELLLKRKDEDTSVGLAGNQVASDSSSGSALSTPPPFHKKVSIQHNPVHNNSEFYGSLWRTGHWMHFTTLPEIQMYYTVFCSPASYSTPGTREYLTSKFLCLEPWHRSWFPFHKPCNYLRSKLWNSWMTSKLYNYARESSAWAVHSGPPHSHHLPAALTRQHWECCHGSCWNWCCPLWVQWSKKEH